MSGSSPYVGIMRFLDLKGSSGYGEETAHDGPDHFEASTERSAQERETTVSLTMKRLLCTSLLLATVTSAGCSQLAERYFIWNVKNKPVPDFELTAIDGAKVRLSHYRGRPVVLAFWSHH